MKDTTWHASARAHQQLGFPGRTGAREAGRWRHPPCWQVPRAHYLRRPPRTLQVTQPQQETQRSDICRYNMRDGSSPPWPAIELPRHLLSACKMTKVSTICMFPLEMSAEGGAPSRFRPGLHMRGAHLRLGECMWAQADAPGYADGKSGLASGAGWKTCSLGLAWPPATVNHQTQYLIHTKHLLRCRWQKSLQCQACVVSRTGTRLRIIQQNPSKFPE